MIKIIGAGLAGLLAANMLRHRNPEVIEKQSSLPNNHSAVLRFRSRVVSDVTGIEFKKVNVIKTSLFWRNPIADNLAYAEKCTGTMLSNRSIPTGVSLVERYIAPADLIQQLAEDVDITYDIESDWLGQAGPTISTIPMPVLMDVLGYEISRRLGAEFKSIPGVNIKAKVAYCDAYCSLYVPNPIYPYSRISLTGDELIVEVPFDNTQIDITDTIMSAASWLGIPAERLMNIETIKQQYSKIQEIDEGTRKRFITWASDEHNIYSLGRYACWRPGLLLDDLVKDIRLIERWSSNGGYTRRLHT